MNPAVCQQPASSGMTSCFPFFMLDVYICLQDNCQVHTVSMIVWPTETISRCFKSVGWLVLSDLNILTVINGKKAVFGKTLHIHFTVFFLSVCSCKSKRYFYFLKDHLTVFTQQFLIFFFLEFYIVLWLCEINFPFVKHNKKVSEIDRIKNIFPPSLK